MPTATSGSSHARRMSFGGAGRTSLAQRSTWLRGDHPAVVEAAAIGVPAELGKDEVLLAVVKGREPRAAKDPTLKLRAARALQGAALCAVRRCAAAHADPSHREVRNAQGSDTKTARGGSRLIRCRAMIEH